MPNRSIMKKIDIRQLKTRNDVKERWQVSVEKLKRMEKAGLLRAL